MCWGFQQLHTLAIDEWLRTQKGGHFQFLTNQGLVLAIITMSLSLISDLFPLGTVKQLKRAFMLISLPVSEALNENNLIQNCDHLLMQLAVVISSIYWTLLMLLPALILPPQHDYPTGEPSSANQTLMLFRIPLSLDLTLHASPVLSLLIDFFFLERRYSQQSVGTTAPLISILYGIGYACFVEYCASYNGNCKPSIPNLYTHLIFRRPLSFFGRSSS